MPQENHDNAATATEIPTMSEVVGDGPEAHRLVRVGAWEFTAWTVDEDEPRIQDLELGARLGYGRERSIRDLIRGLLAEGKLNDYGVRRAALQTSERGGRPATEFWLTEAAALKVVAKSGTETADALLDEMIRVYRLARRGLLGGQRPTVDVECLMAEQERRFIDALSEAMVAERVALRGEFQEMLAAVGLTVAQNQTGAVGANCGLQIKRALIEYGRLMAPPNDDSSYRSWNACGHAELRGRLRYCGTGRRWETLPIALLPDAMAALYEMKRRALKHAAGRPKPAQITIAEHLSAVPPKSDKDDEPTKH